MALDTSEFGRALEAVSEGRQSLDSLLTILTREGELGTAERAARQRVVQGLRESGRLSEAASTKVIHTIFKTPIPMPPPTPSAPSASHLSGHPSNWTDWGEGQPAAPPLTPGCVLRDRFVLEEVIGSGGMSVVFRALDRRREEAQDRQPHVAIKVLGDEFKRHPDALRALQRESRKTQRLAHPNIASVYDFDRDGPNVYMVMELLVGETLDELLRRRGGVGLEKVDALRMLHEMGAALSHAHGHEIVHSDFKPSNVFVTRNGETKVIDFGVARATKPKNADTQAALTMFDAGKLGAVTVAYCSPEQMLGDADSDPRDDVYALGIVAYELLAGRHPFRGRSALEAQHKGMEVETVESLTADQNAALRGALAYRREQRTASVDELLQGLGVHTSTGTHGLGRTTTNHELPQVAIDKTRYRSPHASNEDYARPAAAVPAPGASWQRGALIAFLLLAVSGGGYYGFQQWQTRAGEELNRQRRATEEAERGRQAAEELVEIERLARRKVEDERLARQKVEDERLAAEATRRREAKARANAEKARLAAESVTPAEDGSGAEAELQRALAAEEAEQARRGLPAVVPQPIDAREESQAEAPARAPVSAPAGASKTAGDEPSKRTLYRWQDETGAVHYGAEVPEEYKDSAIVMLPGE